ncbi:MAG: 3-hydroxyacyl-ACP dehydratase [Hylemonella sp.]|nr:3-hydroxyacyl-ACP dehydratase [Hylemonella sp.]
MPETLLHLQVPQDHPSYAGHFPGQPIVPGVMLLDLVLQAAEQWPQGLGPDGPPFEIPVCKFLQPVLPGAVLTLTLSEGARAGALNFRLQQGAQLVASGSLRRAVSAP